MIPITAATLASGRTIGAFIAAESDDIGRPGARSRWMLRREDGPATHQNGWIFREHPNFHFGHSGFHESAHVCISQALDSSNNTTVFAFQSQEEMNRWLNRPQPSTQELREARVEAYASMIREGAFAP